MHFNLDNSITRAGLTATALDIKAETALLVAANLGFIGLGKQIANIVKDSSIGSRIRARCSANRTLVNINQSIHNAHALIFLNLPGLAELRLSFWAMAFLRIELTSVDLPDPETPVTAG